MWHARASRAVLTSLLVVTGVALPLAVSAPAPCQSGECAATACREDLDCPRGCACSQDMDEESKGVCVPTTDPL